MGVIEELSVPGDGHHFQVAVSYDATCLCGEPEHSQKHAHRFYSPGYDTTLPCACGQPVTSPLHACRDCGAQVGQPHDHGCDVERCQYTGMQWIACGGTSDFGCCCEDDNGYDADGYTVHTCGQVPHDCGSEVWTGVWPGYVEAIEYGWFVYWVPMPEHVREAFEFGLALGLKARKDMPYGWVACGPEHSDAVPDVTRLIQLCDWDHKQRRWVRP